MNKKTPVINDFRAGELTPIVDARADLKDYYRGCRTLENAMPIIEGGVARVPGSYYIRPVKTDEGWNIRVTKSGDGTGVVTSDVAGIDCGSSCYSFFTDGSTIALTATADSGNEFIEWSGDGTGAVTRSVLMDGDKVVNAEFSSIIKNANLIGWYKFDEGSGTVVTNSATDGSSGGGLLGNMAVEDVDGDFWTHLPGFGATNAITGHAHAALNPSPARTIGGTVNGKACFGIFHRRTTASAEGGRLFNMRQVDGSADVAIAVNNTHATDVQFAPIAGTICQIELGYSAGNWYFFFLDSTGRFCRVNPDGTLSISTAANGAIATARTIGFIDVGWGTIGSDGCRGAYGDFILYNFNTLTQAEWGSWYDKLRSRYSMSARSGW